MMKIVFFLLTVLTRAAFASEIQVVALFDNKALILFDGKRQLLKVNEETPEGVYLVRANSQQATIRFLGETKTYLLSRDITQPFGVPDTTIVRVSRNRHSQYVTYGRINNHPVDFLLDTGANVIAINEQEARRLSIDYKSGELTLVETASSNVKGYHVILKSVSVGGIRQQNVHAVVLEGDHPVMALLGMSYLKNVSLKEENNVMTLKAR